MGQFNDLPQYQASPSPAQLASAPQCVEKAQACEHKCVVSKGGRRCLWVAVSLLFIATAVIGVYLTTHHKSSHPPSNNNQSTLQQVHAHALITKTSISSLESTSESSSTPTTMLSLTLAPSDAPPITITIPWLSNPSATAHPSNDHIHQQLAMAASSTRRMVSSSMTMEPSLTMNDHNLPTFVANQEVGWMPPHGIPSHLIVNQTFKPAMSSMTFKLVDPALPSMTTQLIAAVAAAAKPSSTGQYKPIPTDHYIKHGNCTTDIQASACLRRGFECIEERTGAGPLCVEYKPNSALDKDRKHLKADGHGKLIGGIVGGVLGGLLLLALLWFLWRRKCHKDQVRAAGNGPLVQPVDTEVAHTRPVH